MSRIDLKSLRICPRCGRPISYIERQVKKSNVYYVAVHYLGYTRVGNKIVKRVEKCYLGPEDYVYVTLQHRFTLHGWVVPERELEYLRQIVEELRSLSEAQVRLVEKLQQTLTRLEKLKGAGTS